MPLLGTFRTWLDELAPHVVPKTEIATAVGYALNQWEAFIRYCDEGRLIIDNELTALLPDRWHAAHPEQDLEINRKTRLVGEAV